MENQSIKHLVGILYEIFVKVDQFIFSPDFLILDCETDYEISIILGDHSKQLGEHWWMSNVGNF